MNHHVDTVIRQAATVHICLEQSSTPTGSKKDPKVRVVLRKGTYNLLCKLLRDIHEMDEAELAEIRELIAAT